MRSKFTEGEKRFTEKERVLRFNSKGSNGQIHSVPVCFGFDGERFYFHRLNPTLKRWRNVVRDPRSSVELDRYSDDWSKLRGVLAFGTTRFVQSGKSREAGVSLLRKKYPQYRDGRFALTDSTVVAVFEPTKVSSWYINK